MAAARFYSSTAGAIDLTSSIGPTDTAISVSSTTGLPGATPYTLVLDPGQASEEVVNVTNVSGFSLTISRGVDGTSATSHSAGVANVRHMATARDFREPQEHIGSTANIHGVGAGSDVVGTATVQTLTNKTAQASTAGTVGLVVKGATSQTADYFAVKSVGGTDVLKVGPGVAGTVQVPGSVELNDGGTAGVVKYAARISAAAVDVVAAIFKAAASQTADILQIQNSGGTVLSKFDKDGNLTAPAITATGAVSAASGTFSGAISSTTTTSLDGRVGAIETNLGSQTAFASASATKDGKRLHWGKVVTAATDASGYATVTHGAGFTPTTVVANSADGYQMGTDTVTATTFRVQVLQANGAVYSGVTTTVMFICGE